MEFAFLAVVFHRGVHLKNTNEIGAVSIKRKGVGNRQEIPTELSNA